MNRIDPTYLDDCYHTENVFYCQNARCSHDGVLFAFTPETFTKTNEWVGADGSIHVMDDHYPACPHCGEVVEEAEESMEPALSDYSERMNERRQMGLSNY